MQTLEKYKASFDDIISAINEFEFDDTVTLQNVVTAIQRAEQCMKVVSEIENYVIELGDEGMLIDIYGAKKDLDNRRKKDNFAELSEEEQEKVMEASAAWEEKNENRIKQAYENLE